MKKIYWILFLLLFTNNVFSSDTTKVRIHDQTDMTWYGNYDEWGVLPDASEDYRKIYLHYTMGCATGGCSDWDYTTQIFLRHRTGEIDSTLQSSHTFTVNGEVLDSIMYSETPYYIYSWDVSTNALDSSVANLIEIIQYNDSMNPTNSTDTQFVYAAGFYNYVLNNSGDIIDSVYISPSSVLFLSYYNWYQTFDVIEDYELARVITPYGGNLSNDWKFTTKFDITDFVQILRDSVEIRCHYSGWSSGFSATLDFEFIKGTPAREVMKIENVYSGSFNYINSSDFESNKLPMKYIETLPFNGGGKLRFTASGHGFDNNQSAAEFKPINYYVKHNGMTLYTQYNWDEKCGENPIYPQGGTWIYDRANWCPGTRAQTFEHEMDIFNGDPFDIDVDFQSYTWSGSQTPSYIIESQFVQYKEPNFSNSVEILDIIKPSLQDEFSRKNPICGKPLIKIRNYGSSPLTSLDIEYNVRGGETNTYIWQGNLAFLETEEVELPNLSNWVGNTNTFEVTLRSPNGQNDEYNQNNSMQSEFETVPEYPQTFVLWVNTNNGVIGGVSESSWKFLDEDNGIYLQSGNLAPNSQLKDTITFLSGCYTFIMNDTDEDGLSFWNNNDGNGMVRFRGDGGPILKAFNPDFGSSISHQFIIGGALNTESNPNNLMWEIYPNPTNNIILINGFSEKKSKITLLDNIGKVILEKESKSTGYISETLDLSKLDNGIYSVQIIFDESIITRQVVKQ
jgi:hypothetical protein